MDQFWGVAVVGEDGHVLDDKDRVVLNIPGLYRYD